MQNNKFSLVSDLYQEMKFNKCYPENLPIIDDQSHIYNVNINKTVRPARYTASWYPQESSNEQLLICHYGFLDSDYESYDYSSLMKKK